MSKNYIQIDDDISLSQMRLLYKNLYEFNNGNYTDNLDDKERFFFVTQYISSWFLKWCIYERRKTQDQILELEEISSSTVIIDRFYLNLSKRFCLDIVNNTKLYDRMLDKFYQMFSQKNNLEIFKSNVLKAIGELKNNKINFQKRLGNIDKAVNEVIMETIDIFILKDKDNPTVSFKKLFMIWSDMIKGK